MCRNKTWAAFLVCALLLPSMLLRAEPMTNSYFLANDPPPREETLIKKPDSDSNAQSDPNYQTIYTYILKINKKASPEEAAKITECLLEYSKQHDMDPKIGAAVIAHESRFNRHAVSRSGAKGLGQIKDLNFPRLKITNPFDIEQNVSGTMMYLKQMMNQWRERQDQLSLALASYYKGPGAMKRANGQMDGATQRYVSDILASYDYLHQMKAKEAD